MNKFEVVILLSPDTTSQGISDEINFFKDLITSNTGKIINEEDWGLRELSYNILKFKKAFYKFFQIEISGDSIDKIKKNLNQSDNFLRHLFIKVKQHQELPTKLIDEKK
ncbi:MAG: 30S ribosomal protein S6 [Alphaproteobacteria bacterium]